MDDFNQTMRELDRMLDWYWQQGNTDQQVAQRSFSEAMDSGQPEEILKVARSVYELASYYWNPGSTGQTEMLGRLEEIFG